MLCSFDLVVYIIFLITHSLRRSPLATATNMYQGSNTEIRDQSSQEKGKKVVEVVAKLNFPFFPFGRGIPIQIMYTSWSEVLFLIKSLKCIWSCVVWWDIKIVGDVTLVSSFSDSTCCHRAILSPIASSLDLFYSLIILLSKYVFQIKIRICLISENY